MFLWKSNVTNRLIAAESESDAIAVLEAEYGPRVSLKRTAVITRMSGPLQIQDSDGVVRHVDEKTAIRLLAAKRGLVDEP